MNGPYFANPSASLGQHQVRVFGVHLVAEMLQDPPVGIEVHCPKGHPVQYGRVVAHGDGFDAEARSFRAMPPVQSIISFEEHSEEIEGHYFFADGHEYRILHLDAVTISFTPPGKRPPTAEGL